MKKYRHAVSALVLKDTGVCSPDGCTQIQSILLVHKPRKRDAWQLPQGGLEAGETEVQAAFRELHEETGLKLNGEAYLSAQTYSYDFPPEFLARHHPVNVGQKLSFVVLEAPSGIQVIVDDREVDAYLWVLPQDLKKYIHRPEYLTVITRVLEEYQQKKS